MNVDTAVLRKEAANFERIADSLKDQASKVQQTATDLLADHSWKGPARDAAQTALNRYVEAAQAMARGLNDTSTNLGIAGLLYDTTDGEQSSRLTHAMGLGDNADDKKHGHVQTADDKHHDGHVHSVDNANGGIPQLPRHDPPYARWDGPPPPDWRAGTGYWALDTGHPMAGPNNAPNPSLYQSNPPRAKAGSVELRLRR